jgi:hypothetical protein
MVVYDRVAKVVAPKQAALAQATSDLEAAQTALAGKQAELRIVVEQLEKLQEELRVTEEKKDSLLKQVCGRGGRVMACSRRVPRGVPHVLSILRDRSLPTSCAPGPVFLVLVLES